MSGIIIDRATYSELCDLMDSSFDYMATEVPYVFQSEIIDEGRYYITKREWVEWKSMEEKEKWEEILANS